MDKEDIYQIAKQAKKILDDRMEVRARVALMFFPASSLTWVYIVDRSGARGVFDEPFLKVTI